MKRSLLVAAGTAAGVTAVVSYHATASTSAGFAASAPPVSTQARTTAARTTTATTSSPPAGTTTTTTTTTTTAEPRTARKAPATRSAVGEAVSFPYGSLQLKVIEHNGKITNVSIVSFQVSDPHSESIDEFAVPQLRNEVIAAQSAKIDGVSGASYTSQAYAQSVQSALDKL